MKNYRNSDYALNKYSKGIQDEGKSLVVLVEDKLLCDGGFTYILTAYLHCHSPPREVGIYHFNLILGGNIMYKRNDGTEPTNALQNQFTVYITTSIHRSRLLYLRKKARMYQRETALEEFHLILLDETDGLEQLEVNQAIGDALKSIKEKERKIFLARVIEEKSFNELAAEMNMGYKGVAAAYYRTVEKLRRILGGDDNEF